MSKDDKEKKGGGFKKLLAKVFGVICGAYLANFGMGVGWEIPDNFPIVGNIDEIVVSLILFICLDALGIGPDRFLKRKGKGLSGRPDEGQSVKDAEIVEKED